MQTFLPYPDLRASCQVLDDRRLGKQRVETFQILRALTWPEYAWKNHPAVRMWRGFVPGLVAYGVESCREWTRRGHADTVLPQVLDWTGGQPPVDPPLPPWWGLVALHRSHRSALLRKDPARYRPVFGEQEPDDLPYLWPPDVYPRWPVRRGDRPDDLGTALAVLGLATPRAGQTEAVEAVRRGRDCVLVAAPGHGGSTAGLLAGLATPGTTAWLLPADGEVSYDTPDVPLQEPTAGVPARADAEGAPAPPRSGPPPLARPPSAVDLAAMRAEQAPPEFAFARDLTAVTAAGLRRHGLLVLDGADRLPGGPLPEDRPPALVVVPCADAAQRDALHHRLGLREPVHAGGGWDPAATWLGVQEPQTTTARRRVLTALVREHGPAVVVAADGARGGRVAAGLLGDGLRAAVWAPSMRAGRAAAAIGSWRSRRLDALVVPDGERPPLGRARVRLLVAADPPAFRTAWRDVVAALAPERAVLLAGPQAAPDVAAFAAEPGCRRAALLAPLGEPVAVPCGRCDRCGPTDRLT